MFFIWLILVGILYCPFRTWGCGLLLKHGKSYLPIVPKTVAWAQHLFLHYLLFTYFYLFSLNIISNLLSQHAVKVIGLKAIINWLLNFLAEFVVISPLPLLPPSSRDRFPFQNFVNFFDHIKCKNTMPFFAISNSSPFNFTP